ncbi:MAG: helix-turn-helix transcriptional regulator [Halodesulfurarchaeum sp.]
MDEDVATWVRRLSRRCDFLEAMREGPKTPATLVEELGVSRSTVSRALTPLTEAGLVTNTADGYRTTVLGRVVLDRYATFERNLGDLFELRDLLDMLPPDAPLETGVLLGATGVHPEPGASYRPGNHMAELLEETEQLLGVTATHSHPGAVELFHRRVTEEGMSVRLVIAEPMFERIRDRERFREMIRTERFEAWTVPSVPYGLFHLDLGTGSRMTLLVYDDADVLKGVIENETSQALEWARTRIEARIEEGRPVHERV